MEESSQASSKKKTLEQVVREQETKIMEAYLSGITTLRELAKVTGADPVLIKAVIQQGRLITKAEIVKQTLAKDVFSGKVPTLKSLVGLTISIAEEYLTKLSMDKDRLASLSLAEVKDLTSIGKNWNEVLRLDLGEATSIENVKVVHSLEATENIFSKLREIDPVFEYPAIDVTPEASNIGGGETSPPVSCRSDDENI